MRWRRSINEVLLTLLAGLLAAGNLWFAAARSTIPLALDDTVVSIEKRREKHLGIDDVYLLKLSERGALQVDGSVFALVSQGDHLSKSAWSKTLLHNGTAVELGWSEDTRGLVIAMPASMAVLFATLVCLRIYAICARLKPAATDNA